MKLRNLFITLGLSLTVGAGVLIGVNAQQKEEPVETVAAGKDWYFENNLDWTDMYIHLWGGTDATAWPGTKLTDQRGRSGDGKKMFYFNQTGNSANFLLHNGSGTQTKDWQFSWAGSHNAWKIKDDMYQSNYTYTPQTYTPGYYLVGDQIGWGLSDGLSMTNTSTNVYSITRDFQANEIVKAVRIHDMYDNQDTWYEPSNVTCNHDASYPVGKEETNAKVTNAGNYTLNVNVSSKLYAFEANDFITPVVKIYYKDGTTGAISSYNSTTQQSEITVELKENDEFTFQIVSSFGTYYYGYSRLETGDGSAIGENLVEQGTQKSGDVYNIKVKSALVYSMYVKDSGTVWMQKANDSTQAYAWATYFLDHVGCDSQGVSEPSGWSDVSSRYASLPSTAKETYIINGTADEHSADEIKQALARYDYAVTHHAGLTRFIVGRTVASNRLNILSQESNSVMPAVIVIIGIMGLTTVAGYYFFKRSKKA